MTNRELDALVQKHIFGSETSEALGQWFFRLEGNYWPPVPNYTSDAAADYAVLCKVRETWDEPMQDKWHVELQNVWMDRRGGPMLIAFTAGGPMLIAFTAIDYLPGDYSKAALAALGIEVEQ